LPKAEIGPIRFPPWAKSRFMWPEKKAKQKKTKNSKASVEAFLIDIKRKGHIKLFVRYVLYFMVYLLSAA
jgi:hypothetical protein